jgi:hypothetical protein
MRITATGAVHLFMNALVKLGKHFGNTAKLSSRCGKRDSEPICPMVSLLPQSAQNGSYPAGRSPEFKIKNQIRGPTRKEGGTAHDQLVKHLLEDGWEPVAEQGEDWWQLGFKRRVDR